jgi:hypothetical protein
MTNAPERIWLDSDADEREGVFPRCFKNPKYCSEPAIQYIRADKVAALVEAAEALDRAASEVARYGAQTGSQWTRLSIASLKFRAALAAFKEDAQ